MPLYANSIAFLNLYAVVMPCLKNLVQLLFLRRNHSSSWNIMQEVSSRLIDARKAELQKSKTYKVYKSIHSGKIVL